MVDQTIFAGESWKPLIGFIEKLPREVKLVVWGDAEASRFEREAVQLGEALAKRFEIITFESRSRVPNHHHYPVIGIMGKGDAGEELDFGVRLVGLPAGYQINSLVGTIQAVSFRASNLEGRTRIQLSRLKPEDKIDIEVFTAAENEAGTLVATLTAGFAVASPQIRCFIVMADLFPELAIRYSVRNLPHTVLNRRVHVEGTLDEVGMLKQVAIAVRTQKG